ncbi:MAG TPA: ubiquitin-like domain-containing protein [Candidatus Dormibacteraeota bacterium]|nr:ubiquitin-like domain-containing protein [Candidatus Dormibacteraeota bacterium]
MIGRDTPAFAATSVLSLGLIAPIALGAAHAHAGTLVVDGKPRTYAVAGRVATVGDLLRTEDVRVTAADSVSAPLDSPLGTLEQIRVRHAVPVRVTTTSGTRTIVTSAATVGAVLADDGIRLGSRDLVAPAAGTEVTPGLDIRYERAVDVTIVSGTIRLTIHTPGPTVGDVLRHEGIALGMYDRVTPKPSEPVRANEQITIVRVTEWTRTLDRRVTPPVEHRISYTMRPGAMKVLAPGKPGEERVTIRYIQREGAPLTRKVTTRSVLVKPKPKVVAEGVGDWNRFRQLASRGGSFAGTIAYTAMHMVATAYTPFCTGCDGYTATGLRAGYGLVAVDPRVIPLGTKLFIPGYGPAIAADTGGAIRGNRIDLGFEHYAEAMAFGRRSIVVYILR